jgi:hypothetical protein
MKSTLRLAFVLVSTLVAGSAFAQAGGAAPPKEAAMDAKKQAEMQKAMEAMQKYGALGPEHARLKGMAGTWDAAVKMWMEPGAPAMESKGSTEYKPILGDHFVQQEFKGDMMGQPFTGWAFMGYDNSLKKYQLVWMDSMSTGFMTGEGTADKDGKTVTYTTTMTDPIKNKLAKGKAIIRMESDTKHVFEMWGPPMKGGKDYKMMEITYTKK